LTSRRGFLRLAASIAFGAGVLLISEGLASTQLLKNRAEDLAISSVAPGDSTNSRASLITVKAYYTMMGQYTDLAEENFVLQSPAILQDLMNTCVVRHPSMAQMMGTMLILLDGAPSKPSASLRDGDIVQFIPFTAGG
jgi:molybdopterin converting factor small subunit